MSETLFIRTTRVHDWCYKNSATTLTYADLAFPADMAAVAGLECDVLDLSCAVLARSQAPSGVMVLTLRKQATVEIAFVDGNGDVVPVTVNGQQVRSQTRTRFWDEFVRIAAPESAEISCELTDAGCRAALGEAPNTVTVELFDIQSIAAEESVRMQVSSLGAMHAAKAAKVAKPYPSRKERDV